MFARLLILAALGCGGRADGGWVSEKRIIPARDILHIDPDGNRWHDWIAPRYLIRVRSDWCSDADTEFEWAEVTRWDWEWLDEDDWVDTTE